LPDELGRPSTLRTPSPAVCNRAFKLTPHQQKEARERREAGETITAIARSYAVHHSTISRLCA